MDEQPAAEGGTPGEAQQATPPQPASGAAPVAPVAPVAPASPAPPPRPVDPTSPVAPLEALGRAIAPETIDELWIFPPRRIGPGQSTIVVASVIDPAAAEERRRIFTARFTLVRGTKVPELRQEMTEEGAAPAELVARVVDGVVRRLDDEPEPPRHARIEGRPAAWAQLLLSVSKAEG